MGSRLNSWNDIQTVAWVFSLAVAHDDAHAREWCRAMLRDDRSGYLCASLDSTEFQGAELAAFCVALLPPTDARAIVTDGLGCELDGVVTSDEIKLVRWYIDGQ